MSMEVNLSDFASSHELIAKLTRARPSECSCNACVEMCRRTPCLGTPEDIERFIKLGLVKFLQPTEWAAGLAYGFPVVRMFQIRTVSQGCPFLNDNRCILHDLRLKPTEGVLANCKPHYNSITEWPSIAVALTWLMPANRDRILGISAAMKSEERRRAEDRGPQERGVKL